MDPTYCLLACDCCYNKCKCVSFGATKSNTSAGKLERKKKTWIKCLSSRQKSLCSKLYGKVQKDLQISNQSYSSSQQIGAVQNWERNNGSSFGLSNYTSRHCSSLEFSYCHCILAKNAQLEKFQFSFHEISLAKVEVLLPKKWDMTRWRPVSDKWIPSA